MEPQKSNGALVGSVIIIVILIVGGIYLWKTSLKNKVDDSYSMEQVSDDEANTAELETELNSMDLDSLDEGI